MLDFFDEKPVASSYCYRNLVVDITARVKEEPALQDAALRYDLWYEHTDERGRTVTRRFQASGKQGEQLDYRMAPLRFPVPGAVLEDGSGVDAIVEVLGDLRGRLREDGTIEVRLGTMRWVDAERSGGSRRGGVGAGGDKLFEIESGETVRLELPPPEGRTGAGKNAAGEDVWVVSEEFYAGHREALILTVTRE